MPFAVTKNERLMLAVLAGLLALVLLVVLL
jgi:hypothetical protein